MTPSCWAPATSSTAAKLCNSTVVIGELNDHAATVLLPCVVAMGAGDEVASFFEFTPVVAMFDYQDK